MAVKRIVANLAVGQVGPARAFYGEILGLRIVMDHGWILTFAGEGDGAPQVSIATQGGSGTPVPDLSVEVEVDDLEIILARVRAVGLPLEYGPADEPWGVRRFYVRDPFGRLINVLAHAAP